MTGSEIYGVSQTGLGMVSDIYGALKTGENYEAEALAYERNALQEVDRNKQSFRIREDAKNAAQFGAAVYTQEYLRTGAKKINAITGRLADMNSQLIMQGDIAYEQSLAVDETVGNMMSRNAVDAMKAEARLRAGRDGSGTEGGSTQKSTYEARSIQLFDNAVIIGRANSDKLNIQRRLQAERVSSRNKRKYVASEIGSVFGDQSAGAAYDKGYAATYAGLSKSFKEGYIAHEKIMPETSQTWLDDLFNTVNIINQSGLLREGFNAYNDYDDNGILDDSLFEEEKIKAKNTYPADSDIADINDPKYDNYVYKRRT